MKNLNYSYTDYTVILKRIINPFLKEYEKNKFDDVLPNKLATIYSDQVQRMENFSRPLWGLVFFPMHIDSEDLVFKYIIECLNPSSVNYWGDIFDYDQRIVEILPVILFIYKYSKEKEICKENYEIIEKWFNQINHVLSSDNNWQCFILLTNTVLKILGLRFSSKKIEESINKIEKMYLGHGWYSDGIQTNQRDYYIAFGIHYYLLLYCFLCESNEIKAENIDRYKKRSIEFADSFIYWFADNGSGLPFGRSLTYKFAQSAFWSMIILAKAKPENNCYYKRILDNNIAWWMKQEIFTKESFISIGYAYENELVTEYYNGPGSSYWALKSFAILLLPKNDAFFATVPTKLQLDNRIKIDEAFMTICRSLGHSYAFVNGQNTVNKFGHTESKYEKFVYTTIFGFCVSKSYLSPELLACDSNLSITLNNVDFIARHSTVIDNSNDYQVSKWEPISGISIISIVFPGAPFHIRVHYIDSNMSFKMYDSGFTVDCISSHEDIQNGCAYIKNTNYESAAYSIIGGGEPSFIHAVPNTNLLFPRSTFPTINLHINRGRTVVCNGFLGGKSGISSQFIIPKVRVDDSRIIIDGKCYNVNLHGYKKPNATIDILKNILKYMRKVKRSIL